MSDCDSAGDGTSNGYDSVVVIDSIKCAPDANHAGLECGRMKVCIASNIVRVWLVNRGKYFHSFTYVRNSAY